MGGGFVRVKLGPLVCAGCLAAALGLRADDTWTYAVQLSATVQTNPASITLHWPVDPYGASSYTVFRKSPTSTTWGPGTALSGSATQFTDSTVYPGQSYEYQVIKHGIVGYTGYGYICAGLEQAAQHSRGKVLLIVSADTSALASELLRLEEDLAGDGWQVLRHNVSESSSPAEVKSLVVSAYQADPTGVTAVFLFGRVPILMSGNLEYDSHGSRPMPADAFYGDVDGQWHPELPASSRPSYLPSDVELMVGRVDFSNMPGERAPSPWPNETELLRRYLNKDHAWRHKLFTVPRRAIIANRVGDAGGHAYAASGYRNFQPMTGPGSIVEADISDNAADSQRWISRVSAEPYLWSYGCGGGQANVISHLGTHGIYREVWSTDLVAQDAKVVFSMFFGSHFGEWNNKDNVMRAMLAAPGVSLTACLVGLPHWFFHHMARGEPIGFSTRLSMNNSTVYQNHTNLLTRSVLVNLLGDPTLRLEIVAPPKNLKASGGTNGTATLSWTGSPDPVPGYHVYRAGSRLGPYSQLTSAPVAGTTYTDKAAFASSLRYYMVRAIALQANPSGTYYNLSQGAIASANVSGTNTPPADPFRSSILMTSLGPRITWKSENGRKYHVEGLEMIFSSNWVNISGSITAVASETEFTDPDWISFDTRYYRVVAE